MAAGKKTDEQQPDDLLLADHDLAKLRGDAAENFVNFLRGDAVHVLRIFAHANGRIGKCQPRSVAAFSLGVIETRSGRSSLQAARRSKFQVPTSMFKVQPLSAR